MAHSESQRLKSIMWLTRQAMTAFCDVLGFLAPKLGSIKIEQRRFEAIWAQITAVFSAILLADKSVSTLENR